MSEAAPIKVFVVVIEHRYTDEICGTQHAATRLGSCHGNEQAAIDECERFKAANSWTDAHYVERELPFPTCVQCKEHRAAHYGWSAAFID